MKNQKPSRQIQARNPRWLDAVVRRLYENRIAANTAKKMLREAAERLGSCPGIGQDENMGIRCYQSQLPKEKWCDICKEKLPLWEDYHKKTNAAAASLREVLRYAKTLPPNAKLCDGRE